MNMQFKIIITIFFLLCIYNESFSQVHELDIDQFIDSSCFEDDSLNIELRFIPLIRLTQQEKDQKSGSFSYDFASNNETYTNNIFSLKSAAKDSLDLFVRVNHSNQNTGENYLWILLFTPVVDGQLYGGEVISIEKYRDRLFSKKKYNTNDINNYYFLARHSKTNNNTLIYKKNDIDNLSIGQSILFNDKWKELVGTEIYSKINRSFEALRRGISSYTVSLYFIPTPSLHYIDRETGYRWAINKAVEKPGNAYAMALTSDHKCVQYTSIQIAQ